MFVAGMLLPLHQLRGAAIGLRTAPDLIMGPNKAPAPLGVENELCGELDVEVSRRTNGAVNNETAHASHHRRMRSHRGGKSVCGTRPRERAHCPGPRHH